MKGKVFLHRLSLGTALWLSVIVPGHSQSQAEFLATQSDEGGRIYQAACAACHLANLQGAFESPALAGSNFINNWGPRQASEFLVYLQQSMPPQAPGSLTDS